MSGCSSAESEGDPASADNSAARAAADWVLDQRNDHGLIEATTSYEGSTSTSVDHGSSADLVLALSALDHASDEAAAVTDALADDVETYVGAAAEVYAGPSAKALTVALDQGRDPADFGGLDLRERVEGTVATQGRLAGRISDDSEYGDYANTLGQAYAAGALTRLDSDLAAPATEFLLAQQCEEGFFRLDFSAPKEKDQSCDAADLDPEQAPDVTALVVLQLAPVAEASPEVSEALDRAATWLLAGQAEDGSFSDPENSVNANTIGLAGWALRVLGEDEAADRAGERLADLQVAEDEEGELADEAGAIAYDETGLADGRTHGIDDPLDRTQWVLTGVQAFPALAGSLDGQE